MHERPVGIVTGGSRGIGRAICLRLSDCGFSVVVNYARRADAASQVVELIQKNGGTAVAVQADIADRTQREKLVDETLEQFGRVDVLVNNAAVTSPGRKDLLEATEESWDVVFNTNLKGPFFLTQRVVKEMLALIEKGQIPGGKIINISSISAYTVSTNRGDYCMAKAALSMMTKLFAVRLAESKIQVFEIRPGIIATDMTAPVKAKYDRLIAEGLTPIRRWGQPEDIAQAVAAIVEDRFPFSTGEVINVDGGFHLRIL